MIRDNLKHAAMYEGLGPRFREALSYLCSHDLTQADGRIELEGNALYILPQSPVLKTWDSARWEAHRRYADIQVVLEGEEIIGYAPLEEMEADPYNPEKDCLFCHGEGTALRFRSGDFAIFFPQDVHKPGVRSDGSRDTVKKLVVKVLL